jgi:hypothetical protein
MTASASWPSTPTAGCACSRGGVTLLPVRSCLIDGEAIVCDENGLAVFDRIREYRCDSAAVLCTFDLLELNGADLRHTPIEERKGVLAKLMSHPHGGIAFNQHYTGSGTIIYKHARARLRGHRVEAPGLPPIAPAALIAG